MITKKIGKSDQKLEEKIQDIAIDKMIENPDGFFLQDIGESIKSARTLKQKSAKRILRRSPLKNTFMHFRIATAGKVTRENVQGWAIGEWQFFHNGAISDYSDLSTTQIKSDSFLFFKDLVKLLEAEKSKLTDQGVAKCINQMTGNNHFWGRASLYNRVTDDLYLFGDWYIYLLNKSYIIGPALSWIAFHGRISSFNTFFKTIYFRDKTFSACCNENSCKN